jgi:glycerol-3-phosphate acyltransferase PlsY
MGLSAADLIIALVFGYLCGTIPFGLLFSRWAGLGDIRTIGSGNIGATNVLRTGNKRAALLTLLGDALKGAVAVLLVEAAAPRFGIGEVTVALSALAVFVGHLFPVFHRFEGGKGVATAAGVLMALHPLVGGGVLLTWLIIAFFFRDSSLAALVSAVFAPFWHSQLYGFDAASAAIAAMSALLVWRHRANIVNLMAARESRIGRKKSS